MKEKIICFSFGLTPEDVNKGKSSYYETYKDACELEVVAVTDAMLAMQVGDVLDDVVTDVVLENSGRIRGCAVPPEVCKYRVVIVNTMEREQVLQVMRSFKAVLTDPQSMIFAVITETAQTWTFGNYIGHLMREHDQMMKR